jgi:hypothetical protein
MGAPRKNSGGRSPWPPSQNGTPTTRSTRVTVTWVPAEHEARPKRGRLATLNERVPLLALGVALLMLVVAVLTLAWMVYGPAPTVVVIRPAPPIERRSHERPAAAPDRSGALRRRPWATRRERSA